MDLSLDMQARPRLMASGRLPPGEGHSGLHAPRGADAVRAIADLAHGFSLEITRPSDADIAAVTVVAPAGTAIYLSALPGQSPLDNLGSARKLRDAGLEPVLHVAARNYADTAELDSTLARFAGEAGLRRALVIGGDRDKPAGNLRDAREAIDSGVFNKHGITDIDIAGYPDGHPRLPAHELERALMAKLEAAAQTGLKAGIVTQFAFDAAPIIDWLARLRAFGVEAPVRIGLAGPTSLTALMRFARRCGVKTTTQALARQAGLMRQVFSMTTPGTIVRPLAEAQAEGRLGQVALHLFSFGGAAATVRWASAVAAGRLALDPAEGFKLAPDAA